jgi:lysophospholipase L1-like esterase
MDLPWRCLVAGAVFALLAVAPARAATPDPCAAPRVTNFLAADASQPGVVSLHFFHAGGAPVTFFECVGGRARRLGTRATAAGTPTILHDATTWSCERLVRRFVATATLPTGALATGTYSVRTRSCAQRFELRVPRRVAPGRELRVRVVDSWGIGGIRPRLCITAPRGERRCSPLAFPPAVRAASRRLRVHTRGRLRVELRIRGHRVRADVFVGAGGAGARRRVPTVLATGDSMMQGIDGFLGDELGDGVRVRSDIRPGTAIGKSLDWLSWSRSQASSIRPRATVMAIGANEGWPMTTPAAATVACCDEPWVAEYSRRVRAMMRSYLRRGRGRVVWLTLPAPREGKHTPIFAAVNRAFLRAGEGLDRVTVLRTDLLFTPDGYRDVMRYRGVRVRVREPDGIHLNVAGTAIAATAIARELAAG